MFDEFSTPQFSKTISDAIGTHDDYQRILGPYPYDTPHTETVYTFCIQKLYNMYATDVYKAYTKCIPHFDKLLYTFCVQNQKN